MKMYMRFAAMIITATVVMFCLKYLSTYQWSHVWFSETRSYMALLMGATMAVIMLAFMLNMLSNRRVNIGIVVGSAAVFALTLWLVRSQETVGDVAYMKAMIPHHSIAILTSERAEIRDPRVRELADEIIAAQRREIAMMTALIEDIEANGIQSDSGEPQTRETATEMLLGHQVPAPQASAAEVPEGFRAEVVLTGLTYPTSVEFDDSGTMYVAEAGYSYGDPSATPRILRISTQGAVASVMEGEPLESPVNDLLFHQGRLYVSHRGKISVVEEDGGLRDLVSGLPSAGDHHNNQLTVGPDGKIYFGQGTATNSGVVGLDNFKMGWLQEHPEFHDIPAQDIKLVGRSYRTPNPFEGEPTEVQTSSFHAFGQAEPDGAVVPGQVKAGGTILRMNPDGSDLEVYAWGLRNPFGVMWSPNGKLYASENGCDVRGSRPIANDKEDIYVIKQGAWYGWPDYAMGLPVTDPRFRPEGQSPLRFLMAEHPPVEQPWLNFAKHSSITKLDFSRSDAFGQGHLFAAFFGHMAPMTGEAPDEHGGHRVVRIDPATKTVETFFAKRDHGHGGHDASSSGQHAHGDSGHGKATSDVDAERPLDISAGPGPRRLVDVRFTNDGQSLYIADFGVMVIDHKGARPIPNTGVIWRVVPDGREPSGPPADLSVTE